MLHETEAEKKILEAAREVFQLKGYDGARMQEIADKAKMNKASLHYYFRSKEKLFNRIFQSSFGKMMNNFHVTFSSEDSLFTVIRSFIFEYLDFIKTNENLVMFVINEIRKKPTLITDLINTNTGSWIQFFIAKVTEETKMNNIIKIDPRHLMLNIMSMCIFPIISKPIYTKIYGMSAEETETFLEQRADVIYEFVIRSIRK